MFIGFDDLDALAHAGMDVAIVGTGPAGISLALELQKSGISSLLIEAGGFTYDASGAMDAYQGETVPKPYPLAGSRLRYFGGTSGHWGGWCRPLDEVDFKALPGVPYSGWPITRDEAYRFLPQAHEVLEIPSADYDSRTVMAAAQQQALALGKDSGFDAATYRFSPPTRFGTRYRADIESSKLIHCVLDTSLVRVVRGDGGQTALLVRSVGGKETTIQARYKVLAMGGIENARCLLWSNFNVSQPLGGSGDWIGRCFVDHFGFSTAKVLTRAGLNYGKRNTSQGDLMARIVPQSTRIAAGETSNHMISLEASKDESLIRGEYGMNKSIFGDDASNLQSYSVLAVSGQRPNRDSRVTLGTARDSNGVPTTVLDWRIADQDFDAVLASVERFANEVSIEGAGRLRKTDFRRRRLDEGLSSGMHHLGTTRMATTAADGVVDKDCKVFDTDDLYVAGSSVFTTSGYVNPTLTIVALTLRLADHLATRSKVGAP